MIDQAYLAELQAVRAGTYAKLPNGLHLMAAFDERQTVAMRVKPRPDPEHPVIGQSPAEAVIASYCDARATAVSGRGVEPGTLKANMIEQLARSGLKPTTSH